MNVLIVDDIHENAEALAALLDAHDFATRTAFSASQAMRTLANWQADAVVTDISMPIVDGFALSSLIRRAHPRVLVVAFTATDAPDLDQRAAEAGISATFSKASDPDPLVRLLQRALH